MFDKHNVNIKNQHLTEFRYNVGGGMTGGYYTMVVKPCDALHALIKIEKAEFHNEEPVKTEYIVNLSIMEELEEIIRHHEMNHWHEKKFTDMFVSDGETISYYLTFEKSSIRISSQIFPAKYSDKLKEFREVINSYIEKNSTDH